MMEKADASTLWRLMQFVYSSRQVIHQGLHARTRFSVSTLATPAHSHMS